MEHVIARHMLPVKPRISYFLSHDETVVCDMVTQTIAKPDEIRAHNSGDINRRVLKKTFPFQIGVRGINGKPCYALIAIVRTTNNDLITAYPTMKWLYFWA